MIRDRDLHTPMAMKALTIERECVSRDCDRNCGACDLAQDKAWLLAAYDAALELVKMQEPILLKAHHDNVFSDILGDTCGDCRNWVWSGYNYCPFCGRRVKWSGHESD